ncbi:hypothetical protein DSCW_63830 [Desulfosarcina widdelii]|uniref:Site-specific integrase n=1 Tax=Desulfosarcina widdelii TaxID=947919 RepID=A0A5K7ZAU1_9BACT|nr:site-specific integrase [Desulfosarcina widdelii]BBO78966.1 hypothetical protein DSCW_63830 [Desulfosarcina widdelii]
MANVKIQKRVRQNGNSYVVTYSDPVTGKSRYYKTFRRMREAQDARNELRQLIDAGKAQSIRRTKIEMRTFGEVSGSLREIWKTRLKRDRLREETVDGYNDNANLLDREFGGRLLCEISRKDIVEYRDRVADMNSNVSANRRLFILKQVFKHGLKLGAIVEDPSTGISKLSEKAHERNRYLRKHEIQLLIAACRQTRSKHYLPALIWLGVEHGTSRQEALDLKWSDVGLDYTDEAFVRLYRTKNQQERTFNIGYNSLQALLHWREHLKWMRHRKNIVPVETRFIFCRLNGQRIKRFDSAWYSACRFAGIEDLHYHDLRHTFCSHIILQGGDLKDAKEMIGHSDLSMTDRYTHLTLNRKKTLIDRLSDYYKDDGQGGRMEPRSSGTFG